MQHKAQKGLRAERDGISKELSEVTSSEPQLYADRASSLCPGSALTHPDPPQGQGGQVRPAHTLTHTHTSKPAFLVIYDLGALLEERKFASDATGIPEHVGSRWGTFFCLDQIQASDLNVLRRPWKQKCCGHSGLLRELQLTDRRP